MNYIEYKRQRRIARSWDHSEETTAAMGAVCPLKEAPQSVVAFMWGERLHPTVYIARNAMLDEETLELITIEEGVHYT